MRFIRPCLHDTGPLLVSGILWCAAALAACTGTRSAPVGHTRYGGAAEADSLFFSLERTPCFGPCPTYLLRVYRSGFATYDARQHTAIQGPHTGRVSPAEMRTLLDHADSIGFFGLKDSYDGPVTDLPRTIIRVVADGRDKQVTGRYQMPEAYRRFALQADSLLLPRHWSPAPGRD
ncbi:MAG: hypothetical protein JNM31_13615 [Flavobacteriales bacterium]|nr:hypothetical protein [Flavobacteriales bacterium]